MHFYCTESLYDYTCVRLKALYLKHYNNAQPNLIMHLSHLTMLWGKQNRQFTKSPAEKGLKYIPASQL